VTIRLSSILQLDPVRSCLEFGVHPEWNARNVQSDYLPDGRIWVRLRFKDDGPISGDRKRHTDVPYAKLLDREVDLDAWKRSLYYFLEDVKKQQMDAASRQ